MSNSFLRYYQLGAKEFMKFVEHEVDNKHLYSAYVHVGGYEVDWVDFDGEVAFRDFIKQWDKQ